MDVKITIGAVAIAHKRVSATITTTGILYGSAVVKFVADDAFPLCGGVIGAFQTCNGCRIRVMFL